jgi:hypothetical protein
MSAMQKGIGGSFTADEISVMVDKAFMIATENRKKLLKMVKK